MERQGMNPIVAMFYICVGLYLVITYAVIQWVKSAAKRWLVIGG